MFICDDCLTAGYANAPRFSRSTGLCEVCWEMRSCSAIPSGELLGKMTLPRAEAPWASERPIPHAGMGSFPSDRELLYEIIGRLKLLESKINAQTPGPHKTAPSCEHQWDGERIPFGESGSVATCSRCGEAAVDLRLLGEQTPQRAGTPVRRETPEPTSTADSGTKGEEGA